MTGVQTCALPISCIRIADRISSGGELSDTLQWAVEKFDSDVEVGFIGLAPQGEGVGLANTNMPWASKS